MGNKEVTVFFLFLLLTGCKSIEKVTEKESVSSLSEREILQNIRDFQSRKVISSAFFARTNVSLTLGDKKQSFRCNIFLNVDSFLRISVLAPMGIEAARISLDKDGVVIIDRINKQVVYSGYEQLFRKYSVNFDFYFLQNLLLNNYFGFIGHYKIDPGDYFYSGIENSLYKFSSTRERKNKRMISVNGFDDIAFHQLWIFPEHFYLKRYFFYNGSDGINFDILYDDFSREFSEFYFPSSLVVKGQVNHKKFSLRAEFGSIRFNDDKGISFSIPEKYVKIYQ